MVYTLGVYSRLLPFQTESTHATGHPDQRLPSSPSHCFSPIPCLPRHPCFSIFTAPAGPCLGTARGHLSAYQPAASVPSNMPSPLLPDWAHVFLSCFSGFLGLPLLYIGRFIIWPLAAFPGPSPGPCNMHRPRSQTELTWTLMPHHHTQSDLAVFHSAWKSVLPFLILNFSPNPTLPKSLGKLLVILQNPSSITTLRKLPRLTQAWLITVLWAFITTCVYR